MTKLPDELYYLRELKSISVLSGKTLKKILRACFDNDSIDNSCYNKCFILLTNIAEKANSIRSNKVRSMIL